MALRSSPNGSPACRSDRKQCMNSMRDDYRVCSAGRGSHCRPEALISTVGTLSSTPFGNTAVSSFPTTTKASCSTPSLLFGGGTTTNPPAPTLFGALPRGSTECRDNNVIADANAMVVSYANNTQVKTALDQLQEAAAILHESQVCGVWPFSSLVDDRGEALFQPECACTMEELRWQQYKLTNDLERKQFQAQLEQRLMGERTKFFSKVKQLSADAMLRRSNGSCGTGGPQSSDLFQTAVQKVAPSVQTQNTSNVASALLPNGQSASGALQQLTGKAMAAFRSDRFEEGGIPEVPPSADLCR